MDWTLFWTFIAAIVPIIIALASFLWWFFNYSNNKINNGIEQGIQKQLAPLAEENTNLRKQNKELLENLKLNLQIPSYTRDYIEITEKSAEKRIEEIKEQKDQAIADKDNELAEILQSKLEEINRLNQLLQESNSNTDFLQNQIQNIINKPSHQITGNAVLIRNGLILLVRYQGRYGALQAVDQSSNKRGSFIRYSWWYQPDETPNFINDRTEYGFGETSEKTPNPQVKIGPIELAWSISGEGSGWIYFGPISKSIEYELTPTNESSINSIKIDEYKNQFVKCGFDYVVRFPLSEQPKIAKFEKAVQKIPDFYSVHLWKDKNFFSLTIRNPSSKEMIEDIANQIDFSITIEEQWKI